MKKNSNGASHPLEKLAKDASALLEATAESAEEKVILARNRLSAAIEKGKQTWESARDTAVEGAEAADEVIHGHTYTALGIAFAAGTVLGLLLRGRNRS